MIWPAKQHIHVMQPYTTQLICTQRDPSRRIRVETTVCEPEVVTYERANRGQTGSRIMAATRLFDSATATLYSTSNTP